MLKMSTKDQSVAMKEKGADTTVDVESHTSYDESKWYNKGLKIFGYQFPPYSQGDIQIVMVSFVCFLTIGMYAAVSRLGAGGTLDATVVNNSNVALYSTFSVVGFFAGTICNKVGVRPLLSIGGWGYALYVSSLLCFNHTGNSDFVIASGALLGVAAAFLWTAQGTIMLSYSEETNKGKSIARFWAIYQCGNLIGSLIPLIQTVNSKGNSLGDGSYAAFIVLISLGAMLGACLLPSRLVRKHDNSRVILRMQPTWNSELKGLWLVLRTEPWIVLLFPLFWASYWWGTYESNDFNLVNFNIRTRALNALVFAIFGILGAVGTGCFLDLRFCSRKTMARLASLIVFILTAAIWGGGLKVQLGYTRESVLEDDWVRLDWTDRKYGGYLVLYIFYGFYDAVFQAYCYWLMGALTNSSRKLSIYVGFYKGIQSAGSAVVWRLDALKTPYMSMFASTWALLLGSIVVALPVVFFKVKEETDEMEDIEFTEK